MGKRLLRALGKLRYFPPVWLQGMRDGWEQWADFGCGMTYEATPILNEVYDRGVNFGQWWGQRVHGTLAAFGE